MSLLMNALKKAESAKQGTPAASAAEAPPTLTSEPRDLREELGLDPPASRSTVPPVVEASATVSRPGPLLKPMELTLEAETPHPVAAASQPGSARPDNPPPRGTRPKVGAISGSRGAEPAGARAVFAAKQPRPRNPQLPFYAVMGVCLLTALGYGAYLWRQMQPPRPVAAPGPAASARPTQIAPAQSPPSIAAIAPPAAAVGGEPPPSGPLTAPATTPTSPPSALTAAASTAMRGNEPVRADTRPASPRQGEPAPAGVPAAQQNGRRDVPSGRDAARAEGGAAVEPPANLRITRNAAPVAVHPDILAGYAALQSGDLDRAGQSYDRALRADPANRDALLGAATVLLRLDRTDAAEAYFRQTLRLHPNDPYATAQLAALTARGDPIGALSQVNSVIARESERPDGGGAGGALAFVQGNQLAAQSRWPEAQQAYFNAHRADPGNADYCYNLAISLDRMHEPRLARDFYAKALDLARLRPAAFDGARARARLTQLEATLK